ncbi:hypothetical protein PIIN_02242 [Serendipita indica DSM 11827]|uniref:Uncharacterized protein n=1 Tax=Serendipita indica (strain DSM 11827) TaxID=1109443 RepID=G4TAP9_SERID|nr:hypothetical protein PIIN_02242 [Serendipita indica DSM 11827]
MILLFGKNKGSAQVVASMSKYTTVHNVPGHSLSRRKDRTVNVQRHLASFELPGLFLADETPNLPLDGRKAHRNHLQTFYDGSRRLQTILRLKQALIHLMIIDYVDERSNAHNVRMVLPSQDVSLPNPVSSVLDVSKYVEQHVLKTSEAALRVTNPQFADYGWSCITNPKEIDAELMCIHALHNSNSQSPPKMLLFTQSPWVLSERDFVNFVRSKSMPQTPRQLTGKERLWAKIYDECTARKCRWFAVTSYFQWTFGYQAAFIMLDVPTMKPWIPAVTPLQALHYWIASSLQLPHSFVPDRVMETPHVLSTPSISSNRSSKVRQVFQNSDSEATSDDSDADNMTTYSRFRPAEESVVTGLDLSSEPIVNPNPNAPAMDFNVKPRANTTRSAKLDLPTPGDQFTKEALLPPRLTTMTRFSTANEPSSALARHREIAAAREEMQANRRRLATLDWLDEEEWGAQYGGPDVAYGYQPMKGLGMAGNDDLDEPPSPTSSDGSCSSLFVVGSRPEGGKSLFALAPKQTTRQFNV